MSITSLCIVLILCCSESLGFSTPKQTLQSQRHDQNYCCNRQSSCYHTTSSTTSLSVIGTGAASLLAGSVGGAIGVGVAYPLDTLKTKSQVYGQKAAQERKEQQNRIEQQTTTISDASVDEHNVPLPPPGTAGTIEEHYPIESPEEDLISLVKLILNKEGIPGFFGGVKAMMVGQALIKSIAFSANELALGVLNNPNNVVGAALLTATTSTTSSTISQGAEDISNIGAVGEAVATSFVTLLLAAAFSGFVTSFLVAPVGKFMFLFMLI